MTVRSASAEGPFDPTVEWDRERVMEVFHVELLPWLEKNGQYVGERAMQGDELATTMIRRYKVFVEWQDPVNLRMLRENMREYVNTRMNQ